ncbi:potassium transporter 5-like [Rhododendron vialii]|uniref:potassium transporter 5-like n=1 Tax=Rhododendron vialii TaxID=182163 RepID=UPI00266051DF|nr:potassium transporter 5-like [Rhododendron vialii]
MEILSAVGGITSLSTDAIVGISVAILIGLFCAQRFGTNKVSYLFAPIIVLWFLVIAVIGVYDLLKHDVGVLRAFNPKYIVDYFKRDGKKAWTSLGGVFLCITGTEAMFADLGHFSVRAIQISFSGVVFPALLASYCGQAAYLVKFPENVGNSFYASIPGRVYWPTFVVAVAAAIIASQALISGAFSTISQSLILGCFPKVKVIHTSTKHEGQVYIPEINYFLMLACVIITVSFKTTEKLGNAYGIAVVAVMLITTCMVTLIMLVIWETRILWIALFFVVFISIEGLYLSAVVSKFIEGGYLPLAIATVLMMIMGIWQYVHKQRYIFELKNKVSNEFIRDLSLNSDINRIPGIGLLYSELVQGVPPIFPHFIANIPSIHSVLVFVSLKPIPINKVAMEERFLFRHVEPRDYRMFRCVVRYGYNDVTEEPKEFEQHLVDNLKEFIRHEQFIQEVGRVPEQIIEPTNISHSTLLGNDEKVTRSSSSKVHIEEPIQQQQHSSRRSSRDIQSFNVVATRSPNSSSRIISGPIQGAEEEMQFVQNAMDKGVVYLLGEIEVIAEPKSSFFKRIVVNYAYSFLRKNFRQGEHVMAIPRSKLLRVGMTYEI